MIGGSSADRGLPVSITQLLSVHSMAIQPASTILSRSAQDDAGRPPACRSTWMPASSMNFTPARSTSSFGACAHRADFCSSAVAESSTRSPSTFSTVSRLSSARRVIRIIGGPFAAVWRRSSNFRVSTLVSSLHPSSFPTKGLSGWDTVLETGALAVDIDAGG
jgi:hypothetical protein